MYNELVLLLINIYCQYTYIYLFFTSLPFLDRRGSGSDSGGSSSGGGLNEEEEDAEETAGSRVRASMN